jgi:hypothetical protein
MASNGNARGGLISADVLPNAGGILSILAGVFEVILAGAMLHAAALGESFTLRLPVVISDSFLEWRTYIDIFVINSPWSIIVGVLLIVFCIVSIVGGISAIRRKSFGLSLAGAICALPSVILGILAVIFIADGKGAFEVEK